MKHRALILLSLGFMISTMCAMFMSPAPVVMADTSYTCPGGQVQGQASKGQDVRYCYTQPCENGLVQGYRGHPDGATDPNKCYILGTTQCQVGQQCSRSADVRSDAKVNEKRDKIGVSYPDDYRCPAGTYRGGLLSGQDNSKCYTCDAGGCQEIANQELAHKDYDVCLNTDSACIDRQRREHDQYMQSLRDAAPSGFNLPGKNSEVQGSRNAQLFCEYYKTPEETRFDTNYIYRACIIGYEVGYGKNNICTRLYLFGANASHKDAPNKHAERFRNYTRDMGKATQDQMVAQAIAACEDGWNQYKVDYWYCGGNQGCQRALRQDPSRIVDPGAAPTREIIDGSSSGLPTPAGIIFQTGTPTQTCGSIQTAFFSCGGGGNDIGTSSFWQILQIILNILIALVAICGVGGIVFGAVKYASAGDNSSQVSDAKNIIKNVIIGLVLFLLMWAIIQYFIPGGIL